MLYALLLFSLFGLLLQFYLNRQLAMAQMNQASQQSLTAYALAIWTKDKVEETLVPKEPEPKEKDADDKGQAPVKEADNQEEAEEIGVPEDENGGSLEAEEEEARSQVAKEGLTVETAEKVKQGKIQGETAFDQGRTIYQLDKEKLIVNVQLTTGADFQYTFFINSQTK